MLIYDEHGPDINWKMRLDRIDNEIARREPALYHNEKRYFHEDEVGVIHQDNKSYVRVRDNGNIEMFASDIAGIHLDNEQHSIKMIGLSTNIIALEHNFYTAPTGLCWNGYYINPDLYIKVGKGIPYEDKNIRLNATIDRWDWEEGRYREVGIRIRPFIRKPAKTIYNSGINDLLTELNIPL